MRTLSVALVGLLAFFLAVGAQAFFLAPSVKSSQVMTTMAAAGPQGQEDGCDRRQALAVTGAWTLGASALLSRPVGARADEEAGASSLIFPNVSEPAFGTVCFLEFAEAGKDGKKFGRVEVSLYDSVAPKAAENFKALCAGTANGGVGYKGSNVYRILNDFSIQAGDVGSNKRGASGTPAFGEPVPLEPSALRVRHSMEGMISYAGVGKFDSRFFFNLGKDASWADDRYEAFGRVTKGFGVLKELEKVDVKPPSNVPAKPIIISDAGVL